MFLSVFELFKIGIGPSSSHTVGPMVAARRFLSNAKAENAARVSVSLHGSLAFTGKGHGTDRACVLGLAGEAPDAIEPDRVDAVVQEMAERKSITLPNGQRVSFDPAKDVIFDYGPALPGHANGMIFTLWDASGAKVFSETYYSIGGGFVQTEAERLESKSQDRAAAKPKLAVPYPFSTAKEMLEMGKASGLTIAAMKRANETVRDVRRRTGQGPRPHLVRHERLHEPRPQLSAAQLPGGLKVKRRASEIFARLKDEQGGNSIQPHRIMDCLSVYAMAVNEENAAGGKVVTAPTNGAAGVMPAIIRYYLDHCLDADDAGVRTLLLVSSAIGGIIKHNASISGAEVGCQGEVGSASAMAAAGLCAALGGTNEQVENAAEIALEHHLGMTCDPVGGLVQVPCIERNAFGAVKAVTAASLALRGDGQHFMPLDNCVETMRQTGIDMSDRYKETSTGGLAVNVVEC